MRVWCKPVKAIEQMGPKKMGKNQERKKKEVKGRAVLVVKGQKITS